MPKRYIWHMSGERWQRAMDKVDDFSTSFKAVHERFLVKNKNKILEGIAKLKKRGKK